MNDRRLTDAQLSAALRTYLPASTPSGLADGLARSIGGRPAARLHRR